MRKIVQISAGDGNYCYALLEDGTMWLWSRHTRNWQKMGDIPETKVEDMYRKRREPKSKDDV